MKQNVFSFLILLLLTVACSSSKNVTAADVNVDMVIDMQSMQPLNAQWEYLEPVYRLEIHGNEVISFLPYVISLFEEERDSFCDILFLVKEHAEHISCSFFIKLCKSLDHTDGIKVRRC